MPEKCPKCNSFIFPAGSGCKNPRCPNFKQVTKSTGLPITRPPLNPSNKGIVTHQTKSIPPKPHIPDVVPQKPQGFQNSPPKSAILHAPATPIVHTEIPKFPSKAQTFTLKCYRGEKPEWWPPPETRLACGMTIRQPWEYNSMLELWKQLVKDIREHGGGSVAGYAQYLRAEGKIYALATARTKGGAFTGYNYEIEIKNARTFLWGPDFTLGPPANFIETGKEMKEEVVFGKLRITSIDKVTADYIVLNADTIADSTILAFGHKTGTYEVTFFHDLLIQNVIKCNEKEIKNYRICTKKQVMDLPDSKENNWAKALLR